MAEVVLWQYRWLNPADEPNQPPSMLEWKNVQSPHWQPLEEKLKELRAYSFDGKPCYEVRALGVIPDGVRAVDPLSDTQAELDACTREMDVIYERWPKKEDRPKREELLTPIRARCVEIGQRRYRIVASGVRVEGGTSNG